MNKVFPSNNFKLSNFGYFSNLHFGYNCLTLI